MSTYNITLTEDVYNVSVNTVETVTKLITNVDVYNVSVTEHVYRLITQEEESFNVTNVVQTYSVSTGVEEVYNVSVIMSGGSGGTGDSQISSLTPAGTVDQEVITYNLALGVWQPSGLKALPGGGTGVPEYFYIEDSKTPSGFRSLTDPTNNWNTSKALLKTIVVETEAVDWDLDGK